MWCSFIFLSFVLTNCTLSLPVIGNDGSSHERQNRFSPPPEQTNDQIVEKRVALLNESEQSANICSTQSINIDSSNNQTAAVTHRAASTTTTHVKNFVSFWQRNELSDKDEHTSEENVDGSNSSSAIQIIFTIPYTFSNTSILNHTVIIIDAAQNQLLASLTDVCVEGSSFIVNYSTMKPLPQTICLYLLLNLTSSTTLREIIFCRTIDNLSEAGSASSHSHTGTEESTGPSVLFILSQCVIIVVMMLIISLVHTAQKRNVVERVSQRLVRSRPYIRIFGNRSANRTSQVSRTSTASLQGDLARLALHQRLVSLSIPTTNTPIEEQVLAANDLTSTLNDRRTSRAMINRDLIQLKEFQKRMSISH